MLKRIGRVEPDPPWSFAIALMTMVVAFALIVAGTALAQAIFGAEEAPDTIMTGWAIGLVLTIVFVLVSRQRTDEDIAAMRLSKNPRNALILMMFAIGMAILFDLVSWVFVGEQSLASVELINFTRDNVDAFGWLIALVFMVLLQPIAEELIFRGVMFPAVRAASGAWTGFFITAGFHASFHFVAYPPPGNDQTIALWYGLLLPFADALFFGAVRAYTGNTRAAIIAHAMFGLFAVLKVFAVSG